MTDPWISMKKNCNFLYELNIQEMERKRQENESIIDVEFKEVVDDTIEKGSEIIEESKQNEVERKKKLKEIEAKFEAGIAEEERKKNSNYTSDYVSPIVSNSILTIDSGSSSCDSSSSDGGSSSCSSD